MNPGITIFGAPVGLYTGKVRCYLRKQGIPYVEALPGDPRFQKIVLPAIGRFQNPVLMTDDGEIVQDTADIIDWCETRGLGRMSVYPETPLQKLAALTLDLFGGEGLVRAAMHYRWSFRSYQERFIAHEFGLSMRAFGASDADMAARIGPMMDYFNGHLPMLGVTADAIPAIEESYEALAELLNVHFRHHPYLLGGRPTCADFGFIASLWAHLGRDPYPADMMKRRWTSLYRWVERMNANDPDTPEFPNYPYALTGDDRLPETLLPIFAHIASDFLPEISMAVDVINAWLAAHPDAQEGQLAASSPDGRGFKGREFMLRGRPVLGHASGYKVCMLQRVTDFHAGMDEASRNMCRSYFDSAGLTPLLDLRASRRIKRENHREVWGPPTLPSER